MDWDGVLSAANTLAMAGWAVLIAGPRRFRPVAALAVPAVLSALYAALVMAHLADAGGGFGSVAAVRALFASDPVLVAGWTHYLAFDLIAGAVAAARMDRAGVPRLVQAGPLTATVLLGPLGLLLGLMTEAATRALRRILERKPA